MLAPWPQSAAITHWIYRKAEGRLARSSGTRCSPGFWGLRDLRVAPRPTGPWASSPDRPFGSWTGVDNAAHGISLPYNYWPERRSNEAFARRGLTPAIWLNKLGLDPTPATWFFDRSPHFVARLDKV